MIINTKEAQFLSYGTGRVKISMSIYIDHADIIFVFSPPLFSLLSSLVILFLYSCCSLFLLFPRLPSTSLGLYSLCSSLISSLVLFRLDSSLLFSPLLSSFFLSSFCSPFLPGSLLFAPLRFSPILSTSLLSFHNSSLFLSASCLFPSLWKIIFSSLISFSLLFSSHSLLFSSLLLSSPHLISLLFSLLLFSSHITSSVLIFFVFTSLVYLLFFSSILPPLLTRICSSYDEFRVTQELQQPNGLAATLDLEKGTTCDTTISVKFL